MNAISSVQTEESSGETALLDSARYLTFTLNGEAYALNIFHVTEILEHRHLTVVPMMPNFVRGVINLRGRAVPVVDLAIRFNRGATAIGRRTSIIIVHISNFEEDLESAQFGARPGEADTLTGQDIGILVDSVNKVEAFSDDDIEPPPSFGAGIRADYISGMAKRNSDFTIVLNIEHILSLSELVGNGSRLAETVDAPSGARPATAAESLENG